MIISVGGMIGSGKTSVVERLTFDNTFFRLDEFEADDKVFDTLLQALYEGVNHSELALQTYFINSHYQQYLKFLENGKDNLVTDRFIIEHMIFAQKNLKNDDQLNAYYTLFFSYMNKLKKPDIYIILDINWDTFEKRVMKRGRKQEIDNFDKNIKYFEELLNGYRERLKAMCIIFDIPCVIIDANGTEEEVFKKVVDVINTIN